MVVAFAIVLVQSQAELSTRADLELSESLTRACPIRWQDGPEIILDAFVDSQSHRFIAHGHDGSLWLGDTERQRFVSRIGSAHSCWAAPTQNDDAFLIFDERSGVASVYDSRAGDLLAELNRPHEVFIQVWIDDQRRSALLVNGEGEAVVASLDTGKRSAKLSQRMDEIVEASWLNGRLLLITRPGDALYFDTNSGDLLHRFAAGDQRIVQGTLTPSGEILLKDADWMFTRQQPPDYLARDFGELMPNEFHTWFDARTRDHEALAQAKNVVTAEGNRSWVELIDDLEDTPTSDRTKAVPSEKFRMFRADSGSDHAILFTERRLARVTLSDPCGAAAFFKTSHLESPWFIKNAAWSLDRAEALSLSSLLDCRLTRTVLSTRALVTAIGWSPRRAAVARLAADDVELVPNPSMHPLRLAVFDDTHEDSTRTINLESRSEVNEVVLSPDGRFASLLNRHGDDWLVDLEEGLVIKSLPFHSSQGVIGIVFENSAHAAFSGTSNKLALSRIGSVVVIDAGSGEQLASFDSRGVSVTGIAIDPRGTEVAMLTEAHSAAAVCVWKTGEAEMRRLGELPEETHCVDLGMDNSGRVVVVCSDRHVRAFDTTGVSEVAELSCPRNLLETGILTRDLREFWTLSRDGLLRRWSLSTGTWLEAGTLYDDGRASLVFEPNGHYVATGGADEYARIVVNGREVPLSCYARLLQKPEILEAAAHGETVTKPVLPDPPDLQITAPRSGDVESDHVTLEAIVRDRYGIAGMSAEQDGVALGAEAVRAALTLEDAERTGRVALRIELPESGAPTRVTLRAENRRGVRSPPEVQVLRRRDPKRELYLLALGVGDYDDERLDLRCPVKDVDDLAAALREQEGVLYSQVHVQRLVDAEVTQAAALKLRDEFLLRAGPEDTIIVFAAGHGVRTELGEYWFLTTPATGANPYLGIPRMVLESLVTLPKLRARRRVLLLDTCFAGSDIDARSDRGAGALFTSEEVNQRLDDSRGGIYILAAGADDEFAREQDGNGLFTRALIDGLRGLADGPGWGDGDGLIEIEELKRFTEEQVRKRSGGRQRPTFPQVVGGENFALARPRPNSR